MNVLGCRGASLGRVSAAVAVASVALFLTSCLAYRWKPVAVTNLSLEREKIASRIIRLKGDSGVVEMEMSKLDFPYVSGLAISGDGLVELNLNNVTSIALLTPQAPRGKRATIIPLDSVRRNPDLLKSGSVRFETSKGDIVLRDISRVQDSWVTGRLAGGDGEIRADLAKVSVVEIRELNGPRTFLKSAGLAAGVVAVVAIVVALTKTSCPFVYVDYGNGWELVGEAYSGAAFRSTQRDDLLPLPELGDAGTIRIRLRNEAHETQYTDRAELVIVEHAPHVRALSTFDGRAVLVGEARVPGSARDGRGHDVTSLVSGRDERLWLTDPQAVAAVEDGRLEDQLTVEFTMPPNGTPVLELVAANTAWLDLVFGRFFAAMGDHLPVYLARGNDSAAGPRIQRWREREGVDLIVELRTGDSWQRVAVVPTVGPAALREIAIPLPLDRTREPDPLTVRVRGGLGFWRIDRLALSVLDDGVPAVQRVQASRAHATAGRDELAAISATDGHYDALSEMSESLEMAFSLPPRVDGLSRTAFLFTSGYYNVHTPVQARFRPGTLKTIRDEAGALSRFGRDLAREYVSRQAAATARAGSTRTAQ